MMINFIKIEKFDHSIINKIIEYSLYLLFFLLPFQTRLIIKTEVNEFTALSIYGIDILLFILLILFFVFYFNFLKLKFFKFWIPIIILILSAFISIFWSNDKIIAIYSFLRLIMGIGLFGLIIQVQYNTVKLLYIFLSSVFLQSLLAIWQFLTQSSFAFKWLELAEHQAFLIKGESVIETITGRWLRAYGGLDHPNILGGLSVIAILLLILLKINKQKKDSNNLSNLLFFYLYFFIFLIALFFSFSRAAWIALIIGVLIIMIITVIRKNYLIQIEMLKIILISSISISILLFFYGDLFRTRILTFSRLENISVIERINDYYIFKKIIKDNWLKGVGIGNYTLKEKEINPFKPNYYYQPIHNTFLLVWAEIGILGLLSFISFLFLLVFVFINFKDCGIKVKNFVFNNEFNCFFISLIMIFIVLLFLDHWLWSLHFGILLFWAINGIIVSIILKR